MCRISLALVVLLLGLGCSSDSPDTKSDSALTPASSEPIDVQDVVVTDHQIAGTFRIATFNINWGNADLPSIVEAIGQSDADIVCLQETNQTSAAFIRDHLSPDYKTIRFYGTTRRWAAAGFGVLSRFPITADSFLPAEHGLFGTVFLTIDVYGQLIQVVNVHLQPAMLSRSHQNVALKAIRGMGQSESTRIEEINRIIEAFVPDIPTLVIGDFNSLSTFQAPTILHEHGYVDSFAAVTEDADTHKTWHWPTNLGEVSFRIDYVFHTDDFETLNSEVIDAEGSDHRLVVSELEFLSADDN